MKNIVIICHDFPPLNTVASNRPHFWMQNLYQYGFFPTVFAPNWAENISNHLDKFQKQKLNNVHIKKHDWELFKISMHYSLKSRLISKYGLEKHTLVRKFLSIIDWYRCYYTLSLDEFAPIFHSIDAYLSVNKVDVILVSGGPFYFFKYGAYFSKKYEIPWIPDFRDEWSNLSELEINSKNYLQLFESKLEIKWMKNISLFTTVSEGLRKRIADFIKKDGIVIRNGFDKNNLPPVIISDPNQFIICFAGTIYQTRYLGILIDGIEQFISKMPNITNIKFSFIGIDLNSTQGTKRIHLLKKKYPLWLEISPPIKQKDCMIKMSKASVLLSLIPGSIASGILSTKLNDYIALKKPILNIEAIEENIEHEWSKYLIECKNSEEFSFQLSGLYKKWKDGDELSNDIDDDEIQKYSRQHQTKKLADLLEKVTSTNV